ncbi:uncharacterized protein LOC105786894 [Gossypium raimondii]|uniref:uncharacterized protein LOC105786894 n=1 Tax=Gossypium raimondii TaxID=29730 RepID=UPI00063AE8FA|nr:uncharacterized protein LOC105786894 [Gossypium raimondii]
MLLRSGRRTSEFPVNTTGQQAEHSNPHVEPNVSEDINMANQTLKQLATPNLAAQPPSITFPALDRPLKLNSGFLNLLPKFNELPGEDPYRHVNEFIITCSTMQPDGIEEEQIKLRAFPFSLQGLAKDWLYYMPPGSFTTWTGLHKAFLEKFFPASRIGSIRKEICGIKQLVGESLYEYWERFKRLCASCPQHQISEQLLVQYFYEGLMPQDRGMIDAASGGALVDKTPEQAQNLIANMAQNTQQFGLRRSDLGKRMDEGQSSMMEAQLANLMAMVSKLMTGGNAKASLCGICCLEGHTTDMCPTLQEGEANAIFPNQRKYDPYSATYNEGWRDHPNLRYQNRATPPGFEQQNSRPYNSSQQQPNHQNLSAETKTHTMLEQMMKMMADQKKETDGRFQSLELAVKQLQTRASSTDVNLGNLHAQVNNRLPSQPVANPRDNVSAITLRSGKELRSSLKKAQNSNEVDETEVRKVQFSDSQEENLTLPKADLQPSQAAPKEAGKSRSQQSTTLRDTANFEQETRVPELRAQASQDANKQPRSYVPKAPFP